MKKMILAAVAAFGLAGAAFADPIEGVWKTQPDDGSYAHITIKPCGDAFCGVISRTFNADGEYQSKNIGKKLVRNMKSVGGGSYEGKVWRPSNDKVYLGKADLNGNTMQLGGCIAGGLYCKKQTWKRVK